jgi:hypothetical protein
MSQKIELTADELAAIDQVIAHKEAAHAAFTPALVRLVPVVVRVTAQLTPAVVAGSKLESSLLTAVQHAVHEASVEDLKQLRKQAILKK